MRNPLIICLLALLVVAGCTKPVRYLPSSECIGCERLKHLWKTLESDRIKRVAFYGEDSNEPIDEGSFEEFKAGILKFAGCCVSEQLADGWVKYNRLDCIWKNLEKERILKIAFCQPVWHDPKDPDNWHPWADINEPERIKEIISLMEKAMEKSSDRFANEDAIASITGGMQIVTDKNKFIIPVCAYRFAIRGVGWTSQELMERLEHWGFRPKLAAK